MREKLIEVFRAVRNVPYATDGASQGADLMTVGRGNCIAKAEALAAGLADLGVRVRRVRWRYHLPEQPPEVALLPSRVDVHTATTEAFLQGRWLLVDAAHDPPLAALGFAVAHWDGEHPPRRRTSHSGRCGGKATARNLTSPPSPRPGRRSGTELRTTTGCPSSAALTTRGRRRFSVARSGGSG